MSNKSKRGNGLNVEERAELASRRMEAERDAFADALLIAHGVDLVKVHPTLALVRYPDQQALAEAVRAALSGDDVKEGLAEVFLAEASVASRTDGVTEDIQDLEARVIIVNPYVFTDILQHVWGVAYGAGVRDALIHSGAPAQVMIDAVTARKREAMAAGRNGHAVQISETDERAPGDDRLTQSPLH